MRTTVRGLTVATVLATLGGVALMLTARDQEMLAMRGSPEGCVFDLSCDTTPGVIAARRVLRVGLTLVGAGAVLAGLAAISSVARWRQQVWSASTGLVVLVLGVAARAALLGGYVPPPTFGCQATRTCATDPGWTARSPLYDAILTLPLIGTAVIAIALTSLWAERPRSVHR